MRDGNVHSVLVKDLAEKSLSADAFFKSRHEGFGVVPSCYNKLLFQKLGQR
jgi:hypothetical protein